MSSNQVLGIAALIIAFMVCPSMAESDHPAGTIQGEVLTGPTCPGPAVVTRGNCAPRPLQTNIRIYVVSDARDSGTYKLLKILRTGDEGHFQVILLPGAYRLVPMSGASQSTGKPQDITVTDGSTHTIKLFVDTGLR
jgi:hypothetical protein